MRLTAVKELERETNVAAMELGVKSRNRIIELIAEHREKPFWLLRPFMRKLTRSHRVFDAEFGDNDWPVTRHVEITTPFFNQNNRLAWQGIPISVDVTENGTHINLLLSAKPVHSRTSTGRGWQECASILEELMPWIEEQIGTNNQSS